MPSVQINTLNCLILESKAALRLLPPHFQVYFINSKRRFFLYFKAHRHLTEAIRIFSQNSIRFYRRESLLADRQEHQEQVFHCSYRYKKVDLRRNLLPSTPYNEPKVHFQKYEKAKVQFEALKNESSQKLSPIKEPELPVALQKSTAKEEPPFNGYKFKNDEVVQILQNKGLINDILLTLNVMK